jgi:hypothetical protein
MITARAGRRALMLFVAAGFLLSLITLLYEARGGAVAGNIVQSVIARLLKLYVPLLALMTSFYFSERGDLQEGRKETSLDTFILATTVAATWSLLPAVLLVISQTVEGALRMLDTFEVFGNTLAVAALAFYFSRSGPKRKAG